MNSTSVKSDRRLSVAPMLDHTDRHCRYFLRLISRHIYLYTEMITTGAIIHGNRERLLSFSPEERPLALQLGGSDPDDLALCARIAEDMGYDEVNLNTGCPSHRVQSGRFGACLMAEPGLVAKCITEMKKHVKIPVTVKTRTGIDDRDSYAELTSFINHLINAGCTTFIIHARKAWLKGLSPKENRDIPPLQYETVYQLKKDFQNLEIIINGGFTSFDQVMTQYARVDGVMIGRVAYHDPYILAEADQKIFGSIDPAPTRHEILEKYTSYVKQNLEKGIIMSQMTRHVLGLFQGQSGARAFRRHISNNANKSGSGTELLKEAADKIRTV
ncbi:MAG: tRNA dihydrouridine(20/20a) synthase DusA [Gammaproteobacteria bacterium]|nr:tRNA dihydrouridine(20/20a) synthase DusA [Gammaproteobacteria bacterium]